MWQGMEGVHQPKNTRRKGWRFSQRSLFTSGTKKGSKSWTGESGSVTGRKQLVVRKKGGILCGQRTVNPVSALTYLKLSVTVG